MNRAGAGRMEGFRKYRGRALIAFVGCVSLVVPLSVESDASAAQTQGVTSTTINVGVPYVDLAALKSLGINIDQGSYPDAYNALIANINAKGGINGRKIKLFLVPVNPTGTAATATACTQLIEDDKVFMVMGPLQPECYQVANIPVVNGTAVTSTLPAGSAPNFAPIPPTVAFDPVQLAWFTKKGDFKGKKVALFGGTSADKSEVATVQAALKKDHVNVVSTAIDSAPEGDLPASNELIASIAQRFQSDGANVVVGVGSGSANWLEGQQANQSTYKPQLIATSYPDLAGYIQEKGADNPTYLKGVLAADPSPSESSEWEDPAMQKCIAIIRKAYPSTVIASPVGAAATAPTTWVAAETACQGVALLEAITTAAGKTLTTKSFEKAGYALQNVAVPGFSSTTSFAPGRDYGLGPLYPVSYNTATQQLVIANKSVGG